MVGHASLLQPKIGISGYSIYVIELSLLQSLLLVYHVYRKFPIEGDISARQWPTPYIKGNRGFPAQRNITVLQWPSKSPDPIKHLCDDLMEAPPTPITTSTIWQAQTSVVTWMTKDTIDPNTNNIRSLPRDGEQCLRDMVVTIDTYVNVTENWPNLPFFTLVCWFFFQYPVWDSFVKC